jgi:hypothetical protein
MHAAAITRLGAAIESVKPLDGVPSLTRRSRSWALVRPVPRFA